MIVTSIEKTAVDAMNKLHEVRWDRCTRGESDGAVYGWIGREDGRCDFFILFWSESGLSYTTSSARYSREFGERLGFDGQTHRDCERVEDVFEDLVNNKVVITEVD